MSGGEKERIVCVTGAGGYLGSWLVKFLLSKGYLVHGTLRHPWDDRNAHLKKLENATEHLKLFETDLLDYEGLVTAFTDCTGVFHVASPVPPTGCLLYPKEEIMEPIVTGTVNVLNACSTAKVKKVIVVSSMVAAVINPNWPKDRIMDEESWSDLEYCETAKQWYWLAKTIAEKEALEYAKRSELNIVTVCPSIVIGPMLQSTINSSSLYLLKFLRDGAECADNGLRPFVDVRDAAESLVLVYEKAEAKGRYICSSHEISTKDLVEMMKLMYPHYNYPTSYNEEETSLKVSSVKLQSLGWRYRRLEETLADAIKSYQEGGALRFPTYPFTS